MTEALKNSYDEIALGKALSILLKQKLIIFGITAMTTIGAVFYTWSVPPTYTGHMLVEIGEVILNSDAANDKPTIIKPIQDGTDLAQVLAETLHVNASPNANALLVQITYQDTDKEAIQKKIEHTQKLVLQNYESRASFYQKAHAIIHPTIITSNINMTPVNKQLIIIAGFVNGLIISLFLVLFIEFIRNKKQ